MTNVAGIDVSAGKLDVACLKGRGRPRLRTFEQTPQGHRDLVVYLKKQRVTAVVMEATGIYFLDAALALHEGGVLVSVINPRSAHHFAKVLLQRTKTDRTDAVVLAEYARRMALTPWQPPKAPWLALRDLSRRIRRLTAMCTAEKNRLHALKAKRYSASVLLEDVAESIAALERRIERLTQTALEMIRQDPELAHWQALVTCAKGIAEKSVVSLLGELRLLPESLGSAQVTRHAGLDVRLNESGKEPHRPGRLSKAGNAYLRSALHMPALSLVQHDPYARAHYQALQARGKKKIQALCAIQRKLLTGLWACLRNDQPFDSAKLFAIRPQEG